MQAGPRRVIAGNWKMYKTVRQALELVDEILAGCSAVADEAELLVFPPFTALTAVAERCRGTRLRVGGQNLYPAPEGAYTGEVSPVQLAEAGATHVLIGHSERRRHFREEDAFLARKVAAARAHGLVPVFFLGETLEERAQGRTDEVIARQLQAGLVELRPEDLEEILIAYEPVWAIGTGQTATPAQARDAHAYLRGLLQRKWGTRAERIPLLYGGSVKPESAADLLAQPQVGGLLVGGASLEARSFLGIASAARRAGRWKVDPPSGQVPPTRAIRRGVRPAEGRANGRLTLSGACC